MFEALRRLRMPPPQRDSWEQLDPFIAVAAAILVAIGLVAVYSATITGVDQNALGYLMRQLAHAIIGAACGLAVYRYVPLRLLRDRALLIAGSFIAMLALVHIPGLGVGTVHGVRRWIDLGVFTFQPVEVVKIVLIVYVCAHCAAHHHAIRTVRGFLTPLVPVFAADALLMLQPDFGSTVLLTAIALAILFMAGARLTYFCTVLAAAAAAAVVGTIIAPYRMQRLLAFADPFADPLGSGYHQTHALMAFGSGGWFGSGLGQSVEKWSHLPEAHTDFIISVIAEETGLLGFGLVLLLYGILLFRAFDLANIAEAGGQQFLALLARSLGLLLAAQAFINIGGNLSLLPVKGLTLPLISYGGSSLVAWLIAIGLLQLVAYEVKATSTRPALATA